MTNISRRDLAVLGTAGIAAVALSPAGAAIASEPQMGPGKTNLTPEQALARLREGNARFVRNERPISDISTKRRLEVAKGQGPFAALVGCGVVVTELVEALRYVGHQFAVGFHLLD